MRRPFWVLSALFLLTVAGTALGYFIWVVSGSFWLFLASRVVSGAFSGNISVATAAVADVTSRAERSKAMGVVGAAFGHAADSGGFSDLGASLGQQAQVEISPEDSEVSLQEKIKAVEHQLLPKIVIDIAQGRLQLGSIK